MENRVRYIVDYVNSSNHNNLVIGEKHSLENRRFKCLAPFHGSFYAGSIKVFQTDTEYELVHNKDFVYSDIDVETSTALGQPVANVVIVTNSKLGRDFTVNYTAVGLVTPDVTKRTVALLEAPDDGPASDSYLDVRKIPDQFDPTFHYETLSEIESFEYMLFYLERMRIALVYETTTPIRQYLLSIDILMQTLLEKSTGHFMTKVEIGFKNFRDYFNKANFGLDIISNVGLLGSQAAFNVGTGKDKSKKPDGLMNMEALASFKAGIYNTYLGSDVTILGKDLGTIIPPTLDNYFKLAIGTTVLIDTYSNNTNAGLVINRLAYPHLQRSNSRFNIKKIVNDLGSRCIVVATEIESQKVFIGNISKTNIGYLAEWREVVRPTAINTSVLDVSSHLANHSNPHRDKKSHVELGLMENIPVANLLDVIEDSKERKYLRWDLLDKYMRRFLLKRRPNKTEQLVTKEENLMRNISVVFSQCGSSCAGTNECAVIEPVYPTTTTQPPVVWSITKDVNSFVLTLDPITTTTTTTTEAPVTTTTTTTTTTTKPPTVYALTHHIGVFNDEIDSFGNGIERDGYTNYPDFIDELGFANHQDLNIFTDEFIWNKIKGYLFKLDGSLCVPIYYALTGVLEAQPEPESPGYQYAYPWKHIDIHKNYFQIYNTDTSIIESVHTRSVYLNNINNDAIFIPFKVANWSTVEIHSELHFELELIKVVKVLQPLVITTFDINVEYTYSSDQIHGAMENETQATQADKDWFNERVTVNVRKLFSSTQQDNFVKSDINGGALFISGTSLVDEDNTTENGVAGLFRLNILSEENGNTVISGLEFTVALYGARYFKIGDTNTEISFGTMLSVINIVPLTFTDEEKYNIP
jgi:hypothetical protein